MADKPTRRRKTAKTTTKTSAAPQGAAPKNARAEREPKWPPWARGVVEAMRLVPSISAAAKRARVDRRTIQRLIQRDEAFAVAVHEAREEALDALEETIFVRARVGTPQRRTVTKRDKDGNVVEEVTTEEMHVSDTLAMFYLKRWRPEYRERFGVELTGDRGGPVRIQHGIEGGLTDADADEMHEILRRAAERVEDDR